ncbi:histidine kinase dimerization/phosphoacceptor domain -containing protein [Methanothermobacter sp. K4]|uniref:histidine kinase dimerization/phosphoacceptor domain -containing protein n=1 Tax=Methanothermobacter sp. K4 TaxID=2913262 RepID=UPI001EDB5356|nr:histidine kinase dimerization/phosphoacceptor domain -containing protein [Methanothermobacter sp. K4]MCG2828873.1 response regulator [Methanothermobacter sp. K4]
MRRRVIVVEDEELVAQDIRAILEDAGYEVPAIFHSAEDLLEGIENLQPDSIIMDIMLAGEMDGIEAARIITEKMDVPIIYLTAYSSNDILKRAGETEPYAYLLKPFHERDLRVNLEMAIHKHEAKRNRLKLIRERTLNEYLKRSIAEKEALLRELHHRVKNNLQLIISLLSLQIRYAEDPAMEHFFRDYVNQLRSIAVIHERAYPSGGSYIIDFGDYLRSISSQLLESYGASSSVLVDIRAEGIRLNMDTAVPLALIISELISNSLKHAFEGEGRIKISIEKMNGSYLLVYTDDGMGLPEGITFPDGGSFGFRMIENLSIQLGGKVRLEKPERGVRFTFEFTEQVYSDRMS